MIIKKSLNKSTLKTFTLIVYILLFFLNSCKSDNKVKEVINEKKIDSQCDGISIPIFQSAYEISKGWDQKKSMNILMFKSNITYPSKEIFQFYEDYLKKNGFQTVSLKKLTHKNREWTILHTESAGKKRYSAHFKAFWQNIKKHQIWWLELSSHISNIENGNDETNPDGKQYVVIIAKIFDPMLPLNEINISHFYPELFDSELGKNKEEKEIKQSQFPSAGYYTLGNVQLHFRIATLPSHKENISEGFEKIYDLDSKLYYVSKKIEISEKDIDHLVVKKSDFDNFFNIQITFKNDFINQYQKKGIELKGKWIGLFKGEKLIFVAYFHEPIEKEMLLNFEDLSKLEIILEGMNKEKK